MHVVDSTLFFLVYAKALLDALSEPLDTAMAQRLGAKFTENEYAGA